MTTEADDLGDRELPLQRWTSWLAIVPAVLMLCGALLLLGAAQVFFGAVVGAIAVAGLVGGVLVRRQYLVLHSDGVSYRSVRRRGRVVWRDVEQLAVDFLQAGTGITLTTTAGTVRLPMPQHDADTTALAEGFLATVDDHDANPSPRQHVTRGLVVGRTPPAPDRRMPMCQPARDSFLALAACYLALTVIYSPLPAAWRVAVLVAVALAFVGLGRVVRRPRFVRLDGSGEGLTYADVRRRHWSWDEIDDLTVDPPGGPRSIRVHLTSGRTVTTATLRFDRDAVAVAEAFREVRARRESRADEEVTR